MGQTTAQMNLNELSRTLGYPEANTQFADEGQTGRKVENPQQRRASMEQMDLIKMTPGIDVIDESLLKRVIKVMTYENLEMKYGETVENGKLAITPYCRKPMSLLVQNVENLFGLFLML
jgi:hypothetical protein